MSIMNKKKILFVLLFAAGALIGLNIEVSALWGADEHFTLYQMFAPIAAMFLGPVVGAISIATAELGNYILVGEELTLVSLLRILPMVFAAYYFASDRDWDIIIPLASMAVFLAHPVGQQVWFFSLFWLIPVAVRFLPENLFARSLGTTFTAHAVGGAYWIWTVNMPAELWIGLIPIVAIERLVFASGISISYLGMNTVLDKYGDQLPSEVLNIDSSRVLSKEYLTRLKPW